MKCDAAAASQTLDEHPCMRTLDAARSSHRAICRSALRFMKRPVRNFSFHRRDKFPFIAAVHIALVGHSLRHSFPPHIAARGGVGRRFAKNFWGGPSMQIAGSPFRAVPADCRDGSRQKTHLRNARWNFPANQAPFAPSGLEVARLVGRDPQFLFPVDE